MEGKPRKRVAKKKDATESKSAEKKKRPKKVKSSKVVAEKKPESKSRVKAKPKKRVEPIIAEEPKELKGPVSGKPALIQSTYGNKGNFEIVVPQPEGGLANYWRDNDHEDLPWQGPELFGIEAGFFDAVSMIQSDFAKGNLELVAVDVGGHNIMHFWRDPAPGSEWQGPTYINEKSLVPIFSGNPALIWSTIGHRGNFEIVVPRPQGGFSYYWRDNDDELLPWLGPYDFAVDSGIFDAVTMIQSNFNDPGNLELMARSGDQLFSFWRDSKQNFEWKGPFPIATGVEGTPSMIQSTFGNKGDFELAVPLPSGGIIYYRRDNDDPQLTWYGPFMFGMSLGKVEAVSLIQSNFGDPGHLELVAQVEGHLAFFWRDSGPDFRWNGPQFLTC
jgi:hypothetical protein